MDFDNTIIDGDCDEAATSLSPCIPDELSCVKEWTDNALYMGTVLALMKNQRISPRMILKHISKLQLAPGVESLLDQVRSTPGQEAVVISDANTLFIRTILRSIEKKRFIGWKTTLEQGCESIHFITSLIKISIA